MARRNAWSAVAKLYEEEREKYSFNAVLLDDLVMSLVGDVADKNVADVGAGSGTMTARLARLGARVESFEPSAAMRKRLRSRLRASQLSATVRAKSIEAVASRRAVYDVVLCLNVLDYVADLDCAITDLANSLVGSGTLVLSLPHPVKDRIGWYKEIRDGRATYPFYLLDDYFNESECKKVREDKDGVLRVREIVSIHRTISTYLNSVIRAGLRIDQVIEPQPAEAVAQWNPIVYAKCSRIPYFLVIQASKPT